MGNENTKTRQISSNFVRFFTKNHEKEEKLYDFTQFREARLPKLGKIIQQSWPPRDLPKDWFDFEKSFDLLQQNRDALIHECSINSIPLPRCCCPDFNEHQILEDTRMKHYAKKLTSDPNGRLAAKNYWFFRVTAFMEDLLQFYSEMAFVNEDTSTCDGEGTKGDAENTV